MIHYNPLYIHYISLYPIISHLKLRKPAGRPLGHLLVALLFLHLHGAPGTRRNPSPQLQSPKDGEQNNHFVNKQAGGKVQMTSKRGTQYIVEMCYDRLKHHSLKFQRKNLQQNGGLAKCLTRSPLYPIIIHHDPL